MAKLRDVALQDGSSDSLIRASRHTRVQHNV